MSYKVTHMFPNYLFEGKLELPKEVEDLLKDSIPENLNSGISIETNFGKVTDKGQPLTKHLKHLQLLVGKMFTEETNQVMEVYKRNVEICNPYLISVKPGHIFPMNIEKESWYNACVFLQTTNKGSHLYFEDFSNKIYASPNLLQPETIAVAPQKNKIVFWPSHIPWGMTVNESNVDTVCFICSFTAKMKPKYLRQLGKNVRR